MAEKEMFNAKLVYFEHGGKTYVGIRIPNQYLIVLKVIDPGEFNKPDEAVGDTQVIRVKAKDLRLI